MTVKGGKLHAPSIPAKRLSQKKVKLKVTQKGKTFTLKKEPSKVKQITLANQNTNI